MPGGFPTLQGICGGVSYTTNNNVYVTLGGISFSASASANTKGSWTQYTASTTQDCCLIDIVMGYRVVATGRNQGSMDIGIGASGSEGVIIQALTCSGMGDTYSYARYVFPINIPVGTRIAVRGQASGTTGTGNIYVAIATYDGFYEQCDGYAGVDAIGFNNAATQGTTLTPIASGSVKGSYAQLIASTTRDYAGFFAIMDQQNTSQGNAESFLFDIAVGAAGSEQIIVPNAGIFSYDACQPQGHYLPIKIPAGTRISARCINSDAAVTPTMGLTLYGLYQ